MDTKSLRVEIKDADRGEIVAIFATLDVVDAHDDVTLAGAFDDGAKTRISAYNHGSWGGALPVGTGVIKATTREAQLHGKFFMHIPEAAATFATVKAMSEEDLQEWSYGYDVAKCSFGDFGDPPRHVRFLEKMVVHEVSPVLLGAGVDTRTLSAKSNLKFADEAQAVLAALSRLSDRAADVMAKRLEKGKGLGVDSALLLQQVEAETKRLSELLAGRSPAQPIAPEADEMAQLLLRDVARRHNRQPTR